MADIGPCRQHPQGDRHRCLQLRWWPLPNLAASTPQGARHRRLQLRWWPLSDLAASNPRVPAIDVFNFAGGRYRTLPQAPQRGPRIYVFNFGGGRCRTLLLAPPGGLPWMSSTLMVAAAPSMLPSTFLSIDGGRSQDFSSNWPQLRVHSLSRGGPEGLC
jgi:hypothetical protein